MLGCVVDGGSLLVAGCVGLFLCGGFWVVVCCCLFFGVLLLVR